jgi:hypothetical protein
MSSSSHPKTETDPVSGTLCVLAFCNPGRWTKPTNPVTVNVTYHGQNPLGFKFIFIYLFINSVGTIFMRAFGHNLLKMIIPIVISEHVSVCLWPCFHMSSTGYKIVPYGKVTDTNENL